MSYDKLVIVDERLSQREYLNRQIKQHTEQGIDDPLIVVDIDEVVEKYKKWCRLLPRVKPFYAVKCNNSGLVVRVLADLGCNFDCASKGEIQQVLGMGVDPSRIVYAMTCKQMSHLTYARSEGVDLMTFDNEDELTKIKNLFPSARLLVRFRPGHDYKVNWQLGKKFGCPLDEIRQLLVSAKNKDLNVVGVSFHAGGNCKDTRAYQVSIKESRDIFDIGQQVGFHMTVLDIGGGYPGRDVDYPTIEEESVGINQSLDEDFPAVEGLQIIAEPGRYFVESAVSVGACVVGRKLLTDQFDNDKDSDTRVMYTINDGIYGSFNWVGLHTESCELSLLHEKKDERRYKSIIWGPTCDSLDYMTMDCSLPLLNMGDWVHISYNGAYAYFGLRTEFNSMPEPEVYYFCSRDAWSSFDKDKKAK